MTPSLFSVSYAGLWGQSRSSLKDFITKASDLGFSSVMLLGKRPHLSPLDWDASSVAQLGRGLHEAGVRCDVIAAYTNFAPIAAAEVPVIELQIAGVEALARIGAELGARIVRIFTAYEVPGHDLQASWQRVVDAVGETADRVGRLGLTLALQNHHDIALQTEALIELLNDVGRSNCKLGFDAWSPALRGEDLYAAARLAAPHTALTTNADYIKVPRFRYHPQLVNYERQNDDWVRAVPFGSGFIDYEAFFKGLKDGGFEGPAVYEMCSPVRGGGAVENLDDMARAYLNWMQARDWLVRREQGNQTRAFAPETKGKPLPAS
ncbi:MAG: sugar phosphate isomerase/epimerase family protein [Opitutaceae bacterium]